MWAGAKKNSRLSLGMPESCPASLQWVKQTFRQWARLSARCLAILAKHLATIMAYTTAFDTTTKIRNFSSPNLTCVDEPCGVDSGDTTNGADSVKTINTIMFQVANFYEQRPGKVFVAPPTVKLQQLGSSAASSNRMQTNSMRLTPRLTNSF